MKGPMSYPRRPSSSPLAALPDNLAAADKRVDPVIPDTKEKKPETPDKTKR